MPKKLTKHKHKFTSWKRIVQLAMLYFRICKCGKVEWKGDMKKWKWEYVDRLNVK